MTHVPHEGGDHRREVVSDHRRVPGAVIRTKITDLDGVVTTGELIDHLVANAASPDELATVASLPERKWADYNQALAALSSGFEFDDDRPGAARRVAGRAEPSG